MKKTWFFSCFVSSFLVLFVSRFQILNMSQIHQFMKEFIVFCKRMIPYYQISIPSLWIDIDPRRSRNLKTEHHDCLVPEFSNIHNKSLQTCEGGAQPENRFVSFVRAHARSGCLLELDLKFCW